MDFDFIIQDTDVLRSFLVIPGASVGVIFERRGEVFVDLLLVGAGHIIDHFPKKWANGFMRGLTIMGFRDVVYFKKWSEISQDDRDKMIQERIKVQKALTGAVGEEPPEEEAPLVPENVETIH